MPPQRSAGSGRRGGCQRRVTRTRHLGLDPLLEIRAPALTATTAWLLGCLHHCLATGQHYDETTAFPGPTLATHATAA